MKIPRWADTAADTATDWVTRNRWLTAAAGAAGVVAVLVLWLPALAATPASLLAGVWLGWGAGHDRSEVLEGLHDADQIQIGRLRAQVAELTARPVTEAATRTIHYIRGDEGGDR
jgi:hypothetical protein